MPKLDISITSSKLLSELNADKAPVPHELPNIHLKNAVREIDLPF